MILNMKDGRAMHVEDKCTDCHETGKCTPCPKVKAMVHIEGVLARTGPSKSSKELEAMMMAIDRAIRRGGLRIRDKDGVFVGEVLRVWRDGAELRFTASVVKDFTFDNGFRLEGSDGRRP
jgi:hypothetical protein